MTTITKLEYKYAAGSEYIRIIEPPNPQIYVWIRLGSLKYHIKYVGKNKYVFPNGRPARDIDTFEDIELEADENATVDSEEWIKKSKIEYENYTIEDRKDFSRYEDESGTFGGVRGEIRVTWEEKFVNGVSTGEKRNEQRHVITQMQPLIRWTGGKKRPQEPEPEPNPDPPPPTPTPTGKIRWYRHKIIYDDGKVVYGKPWRDGKDGKDGSNADNTEVIRKFESYKEQTDRRFLQTVTQTQLNTVTGELQKNISRIEQKSDSITSTVQSLSTKLNNKPSLYEVSSMINQKADSITTTVTKKVTDNMSGELSKLSDKIDGKPGYYTIESMISQKVDNITIGISKVDGLNYELSQFSSRISALQDKIELQAKNIDLSGYVKFSDLRNSGSYTTINGSLIKTGKISSSSGDSWIDLNNGNFSFFKKSLFIDENVYDPNAYSHRTRLHTKGTFRVSYGDNPSVELNSGGITLFKDGQGQSSLGTNKIQSNSRGNLQIATITSGNNTRVHVEIGSSVDVGFVMRTYGSLRVGGNLQVDKSIKYGGSISQGKYY